MRFHAPTQLLFSLCLLACFATSCETDSVKPFCGDAVQDSDEACDLGTALNDGSYGGCNDDCSRAPFCGDAHVDEPHETCDLGTALNDGSYGGCNDNCSRAPFCGDGILQPEYEACDPLLATGNSLKCTATCAYDTSQPAVLIQNISSYETREDGTQNVTFDLVLTTKPSKSVYIEMASSNPGEGTVFPQLIGFTPSSYNTPQTVTVSGVDDDFPNGDTLYDITFTVFSDDSAYDLVEVAPLRLKNIDDDVPPSGTSVDIRFMTANLTTGNYQNYDNGDGIRIMKAASADIILVQEFNYTPGHRTMVDLVCGSACYYVAGETYEDSNKIPNGIISKYPIVASGTEKSPKYKNRGWDWAVIDIPGDKDLLVFSLHLHSKQEKTEYYEMDKLAEFIKAKASEDDYYLAFGGDFNITVRTTAEEAFSDIGVLDPSAIPVDQDGNDDTNINRNKPYDWIVFNKSLNRLEIPITLGEHTYAHGHVIDSRVYATHHELDLLPEVLQGDSSGAEHMAVIRDVRIYYTEDTP